MRLLAIDPGPEQSALVDYETYDGFVHHFAKVSNEQALHMIDEWAQDEIAIEMIACYGMAVGAEVFETCVWHGRFIERWLLGEAGLRPEPHRVFRQDVKLHLCNSAKAKDANVRQALIDRYGPGKERAVGRKASPGPLYGLSGDCWAALGVAVTCAETRLTGAQACP